MINRSWRYVGYIGVLVGIITGIITIWQAFSRDKNTGYNNQTEGSNSPVIITGDGDVNIYPLKELEMIQKLENNSLHEVS